MYIPKRKQNKTSELKIVEIRDFELRYDGLYHLTWNEGKKKHKWYIYLEISQLLMILKLEGFSISEVINSRNDLECQNLYSVLKWNL